MSTTISELELDYRIDQASFALFQGKKVSMKPGIFRASGMTPQQLMSAILDSLRCQELEMIQSDWGVHCTHIKPRQWRVMITRRPDRTFLLQAVALTPEIRRV